MSRPTPQRGYRTAGISRVGDRSTNEDRYTIVDSPNGVLLVVADGMGGYPGGDLAAETAVATLASAFRKQDTPPRDPRRFLADAVHQAHKRVLSVSRCHGLDNHPATTLVACFVTGRGAWWAHVGDSRLYLVRAGEARLRTRDHTRVEEMYRDGLISASEREQHPMRHYLTRCVGGQQRAPQVVLGHDSQLRDGDIILLCSDGFWSSLDTSQLGAIGTGALEPCLRNAAMAAEHRSQPYSDNVSAVALRWRAPRSTVHAPPLGAQRPGARHHAKPSLDRALEHIRQALGRYGDELDPSSGES